MRIATMHQAQTGSCSFAPGPYSATYLGVPHGAETRVRGPVEPEPDHAGVGKLNYIGVRDVLRTGGLSMLRFSLCVIASMRSAR